MVLYLNLPRMQQLLVNWIYGIVIPQIVFSLNEIEWVTGIQWAEHFHLEKSNGKLWLLADDLFTAVF